MTRSNGNAPSMLENTANGTSEKHSTNTIARSGKRSTLRNVVEPWSGTIIMHSVRRKAGTNPNSMGSLSH